MEKIHAMLLLEILGRPKEHVTKALEGLVEKLANEKGVNILNKEIHEPIPAKDSKSLFTTFAEIEMEFEKIENYLLVLFSYMPSNVEIIRPEKFTLTNTQLNEVGNTLVQRLHNYDAITKKALTDREIILKILQQAAPEEFKKLTTPPQQPPQKKETKKEKSKKPEKK
ncbi:MAG: hypothetical protein ABIG28_03265 [archaeon]